MAFQQLSLQVLTTWEGGGGDRINPDMVQVEEVHGQVSLLVVNYGDYGRQAMYIACI